MKKWMIALMMAALLIVPMGGIAYAVGEGAPAAPAAGEFIPGDVPAQSGTMDAMVAPVNALVMCMVEQGLAYNDQDDVFLWNSLYYMLSLCGQMDERAELTDADLAEFHRSRWCQRRSSCPRRQWPTTPALCSPTSTDCPPCPGR